MILPQWLDVDRLPAEGLALAGDLPLGHCVRLGPLLAESRGSLQVRLQCRPDAAGRVLLQGELVADLQLQCQRCLEPMPWILQAPFEVLLVSEDPEAKGGLEYALLEQGRLNLWQALEDEALLALPFAPRHEPACPAVAGDESVPDPASPFAVLAKWHAKT